MQRRTFLKLGLAGAAVVAIGGGVLAWLRPGWRDGRLAPAGREVLGAVAGAVLDGLLPAAGAQRDAAVAAHLVRAEATIAGLPPFTQSEVARLLALLAHPAGRVAVAGLASDWDEAPAADVQRALQSMRESSLAMRQQVYHALRSLTVGPYFSDRSAWGALGYPGPREV
jgi:hypothetical protein